VGDQIKREIEGGDRGHRSHGEAPHDAPFAGPAPGRVQLEALAPLGAELVGRELKGLLGAGDLTPGEIDGLARFGHHGGRQGVGLLGDGVGDGAQDPCALEGR
jgi:hypothetical protein